MSESLGLLAWQKFRRSRLASLALSYVVLTMLIALAAPWLATTEPLIARSGDGLRFPAFESGRRLETEPFVWSIHAPVPFSPDDIALAARFSPPSGAHVLGTDDLGRDVLSRLIHGARVSLTVGLFATFISLVVGSFFGALAGYYGRSVDWFVSRLIEVVVCFPFLFLVLGIVALFRPSIWTIMLALGLTTWTSEARFVRAEFLRIRNLEYAEAARAGGAGDARIIVRHLLPNALAPVLVSASFGVAVAILTESALSFLGLGVPLPAASWGGMLSAAHESIDYAWWLVLFPGLAIFTTVASFNVIGERLRDALDPRSE